MKFSDESLENDWSTIEKHNSVAIIKPKEYAGKVVPDVTGMGARDAVYLLESKGLRVVVQGRGIVKRQSIPAGTDSIKGQVILLHLG